MSQSDVSYSCGSCGYPLNLASSNRITSEIGSKYRKSIRKGSISFESVDLSRFTQLDKPSCLPVCLNRNGSKTKLLCRQCGVHIGYGYGDVDTELSSISYYKQIVIKIRALQPVDTNGGSDDRESFGLTCHRLLNIQNFSRKSLEFGCSFSRFSHSLSGNSIDIDTFILDKLIKRFKQLESLSLCGCVNLEDSALVALERYGSKLHSLFLDCCFKVTDKSLLSVAIGCPSLTCISLYRCSVTDNGLIAISESCVSLKELNLEWCIPITDIGISSVTKNCHVIRAIKISHCENIKGVGFKNCSQTLACLEADSCKFEPEGVMDILSGGGLEYLNVSSLSWCVRGNGLKAIGGSFGANIRILNFRVCRFIDDETIMVISKGCPLLKEWNLSLCTEIGFSGWESIGMYCDNLEKLHVNGCRGLCDEGMAALKNGCKRLSIMYISRCRGVSQLAIRLFKLARFDVEIKFEEVMCIMPKHFF